MYFEYRLYLNLKFVPHRQCREQERTTCSGGWVGGWNPSSRIARVRNTHQQLNFIKKHHKNSSQSRLGKPPSPPIRKGETHKILLHTPTNIKNNILHRIVFTQYLALRQPPLHVVRSCSQHWRTPPNLSKTAKKELDEKNKEEGPVSHPMCVTIPNFYDVP